MVVVLLAQTLTLAGIASALDARPASAAARKIPSCSREGAGLIAAAGQVQVVQRRDGAFLGCMPSNGRRFFLFRPTDLGEAVRETDEFTIVQRYFIGVVRERTGDVSVSREATSWYAYSRTRHKRYSTVGSKYLGRTLFNSGVFEAIFLPGGAIAYIGNGARILGADGDHQLAPPDSSPGRLALTGAVGIIPRLYWTVETGAGPVAQSVRLDDSGRALNESGRLLYE